MRSKLLRVGGLLVVASLLTAPMTADASSALRGIMRTWKRHLRASSPIVSGRAAFDEATIRETLTTYIADSARLSSAITGQSADAKDIKRRFVQFGADSQHALDSLGQANTLQAAFKHIDNDCQSCHDQYKD